MKSLLSIVIVVIFAVIAGFSLLHDGLFPTHDGEYHVVRFFLFNESIFDGNFYPRWAAHLNNDFGVPLFNFVYPLPNYIATFLHLFKISFIDSFKISMFAATIIGGVFFYLWSKEFWGRIGGVVSSIFYTFSPYHFVDIYIRGSVGEVWALGFFPAFLWSYTKFAKSKQKIFLAFSSIFLALIIFSHNILALMFFIFSLFYISLLIYKNNNKKYLILNTSYLILLGLGLSAIFWLPAIYEAKYAVGLQIFNVTSKFPELYQLLIPSWGSGFSGGELQNELSYQIGAANLLAFFLSTIVITLQIKNRSKELSYTVFFFISFIFVLLLMLNVSTPIWKTVPFMNYFQFPWRLLSIEILLVSFLAGSIFSLNIRRKLIGLFLATFLIFITFIFGVDYSRPAYYMYRDDNYYMSRSNFIDGTNSIGNVFNTVYLESIPEKEKEKAIFLKGNGKIALGEAKSNQYVFTIVTIVPSEVQVNLAYFPGWKVYVNNKEQDIKPTQNGRFTFSVPNGANKVKIIFKNNLIRNFSTLITVASLVFIIVFLLMNKRFATIS